MSFDAILGLLAVIFFVVLPLISNASKRKPPETGQGTGPPGTAPRPAEGDGEPEPQLTGWAAKLEEARRRIEAELAEPEASTRQPAGQPRPHPQAGPVTPLRPAPASRPAARQPRSEPAGRRAATPRPRPAAAVTHAAATAAEETSEELQITRLGRRGTYNDAHSARELPAFTSRESVLNGIIWHQILSEPPYRRRAGRLPSRLRSP
jgi:hypothetical protein